MKRFLTVFFVAASFQSYGQLNKGTWLFDGSGELYSYTEDYTYPLGTIIYKYTNIGVSASAGYFLANKLVAGLRPKFSMSKGHYTSATGPASGGESDNKRYGIGPFVRYYILNDDKPFNIVADVNYVFGQVNFSGDTGKMNEFSAKAGPVIFFNSSVGLNVLLGYTYRIEELKDRFKNKRNGFEVSIGFQVYLRKN